MLLLCDNCNKYIWRFIVLCYFCFKIKKYKILSYKANNQEVNQELLSLNLLSDINNKLVPNIKQEKHEMTIRALLFPEQRFVQRMCTIVQMERVYTIVQSVAYSTSILLCKHRSYKYLYLLYFRITHEYIYHIQSPLEFKHLKSTVISKTICQKIV